MLGIQASSISVSTRGGCSMIVVRDALFAEILVIGCLFHHEYATHALRRYVKILVHVVCLKMNMALRRYVTLCLTK